MIKRIQLLLLSFSIVIPLLAMDQFPAGPLGGGPAVSAAVPPAQPSAEEKRVMEEMDREIKAAEEEMAQLDLDGIADLAQEEVRAEEAQDKLDKENAVRSQRTVLASFGHYVGLYKGDLFQIPLLLANLYVDVKLYNQLIKRRIEVIIKSLLEDYNEAIRVLEKVHVDETAWEKSRNGESIIGKMLQNSLLTPIAGYASSKHRLFGILPINKETATPIILRVVAERFLNFIKSNLIEEDMVLTDTVEGVNNRRRSLFLAYERGDDGQLHRLGHTPFSISQLIQGSTELVKLISNPTFYLWNVSPLGQSGLIGLAMKNPETVETLNNAMNLRIPQFLFTQSGKFFLEVVSLGFVAQFFDEINHEIWAKYITENRSKLLRLLRAYKKAIDTVDGSQEALNKAEAKLRKFVVKGHEVPGKMPTTLFGRWWYASKIGSKGLSEYTWLYVSSLLTLRGYTNENLPMPVRKICGGVFLLNAFYAGMFGAPSRALPAWGRKVCIAGFVGVLGYGAYSLFKFVKSFYD
jgi:hypothetical protein